jgi:hypothetical protein
MNCDSDQLHPLDLQNILGDSHFESTPPICSCPVSGLSLRLCGVLALLKVSLG